MRQMPLAIFCSWLSFQRVPCETPDSRPPTASRRMTIATLQRITFVQPPLGCDGCRPRRRRSDSFGPLRSRVTSTVGLCLPAVLGVASTSVSGGFTRVALPRRGKGEVCRMSRSPVFFRGQARETDPLFSARFVSPRRTKRFPLRAPFVANRPSNCCQPFERQPEPPCRPRTTSPSWEPRAPSAAESRTNRMTLPPPVRSSRHSYAGFATSAELPTCLHAMRDCARSARRTTSPP